MGKKYNVINIGLSIGFLLTILSMKTLGDQSHHVLFFMEHDFIRYIVFAVVMLSFLLFALNNPLNFKKADFAFILSFAAIIILTFVSPVHGFSDVLRLLIIVPFIFIKPIEDGKAISIIRIVLPFVPLIMLGYSAYNNFFWEDSKRLIFNSTDPNFSAFYALMGMMLADKLGMKKTMCAFIILGIMTVSRNFILALLFFYFVRITERYGILTEFYKYIKPVYVFLLAQIVVIAIGAFWVASVEFNNSNTLLDNSNYLRFLYTTEGIDYLQSGADAVLKGAGANYWSPRMGGTGAAHTTGAVHNSFLHIMIEDGIIYGLLTFILLLVILNKHRHQGHEYVYAFLMPTLFLGDIFTWTFLLMWSFVLSVKASNNSELKLQANNNEL